MEKGICFLDIDGVINTRIIIYKNGKFVYSFNQPRERKINNKQAILWLSRLCIENNLDLFIISNWKNHMSDEALKETLYKNGLIRDIRIIGIADNDRDISIINYLNNNPKLLKYVILDDNIDKYKNYPELIKHIVECDLDFGFQGIEKYEKALKILKKENK